MNKTSEIESVFLEVSDMYRVGAMPVDAYYKCVVSLAYEWICAGDLDRCLELLNKCPETYYRDTQPLQVEEDSMYCALVIELAHKLLQSCDIGQGVKTNMPGGTC